MTPGCTFKTAFAVLYLVHTMMPNVFLYNMGALCVWAGQLLPIQHPPPPLTCQLSESSAPHLLLSDGNFPGKTGSSLAEARNPSVTWCQVGSAAEEGCMGFPAAVFRSLRVSCFFLPASPWVHRCFRRWMSQMFQKSDHKLIGYYCV